MSLYDCDELMLPCSCMPEWHIHLVLHCVHAGTAQCSSRCILHISHASSDRCGFQICFIDSNSVSINIKPKRYIE